MHAFFYTQPAQRRSFWTRDDEAAWDGCAAPAPAAAAQSCCLMRLTVDVDAVTALRGAVIALCGDALQFMRIEARDHGTRVKVWLCVACPLVDQVADAVMRLLPGAEFGRFSMPAGRRAAGRVSQ